MENLDMYVKILNESNSTGEGNEPTSVPKLKLIIYNHSTKVLRSMMILWDLHVESVIVNCVHRDTVLSGELNSIS